MRKIKWFILISLCPVSFAAYGQGRVTVDNTNNIVIAGMKPYISITVVDGEAKYPLGGTLVKLTVAKGDTINLVCNKFGKVYYDKKMLKDSLEFTVSCLGYKELKYVHKITTPYISLTAYLEVDITEIATVIVEANMVKMVIRGDTTTHNIAAYNNMRGDTLDEVLKKVSGIEFREGGIFAHGKRIHHIKMDNKHMFSPSFTLEALKLIKVNDVENIKVYDEHSPAAIAYGDTINKQKERVLDITTKSKPKIIQQLNVGGSLGLYTEKNQSGEYDKLYNAAGAYNRHLVNNNFSANLQYGKNSSSSGIAANDNLGRDIKAHWNWDKNIDNYKYHLQSIMIYNNDRNSNYSSSYTDYFPTEAYFSRSQTTETKSDRLMSDFACSNGLSIRINKRQRILLVLDVSNNINSIDNVNYNNMIIDDAVSSLTNMHAYNRDNKFSVSGKVAHYYKFKKTGRKLDTEISYKYGEGWGKGWSVDTLASSTQNIYLSSSKNNSNINYTGNLRYSETLSEKVTLNLKYNINQQNQKYTLLSIDRLTGITDMQNTYDYTYNYLKNSYSAIIRYTNARISMNIGFNAQFAKQNRDESKPENVNDLRSYFNLLPNLTFIWSKFPASLQIMYTENIVYPSIEQVRSVVDTYNAPVYTAGNPSLKETVNRKLNAMLNLTSMKNNSTWRFDFTLNQYQNSPVTQEYFFTAPTNLPEFGGFIFPEGSTLRTTRNAEGRFSLKLSSDYSIASKFFGSKINVRLIYSYDRTPFYASEVLYMNAMHLYALSLIMTSDFSKNIDIHLSTSTDIRHYERDANRALKEISETVYGRIRLNFAKRLWIIANGAFRYRNTSLPNTASKEVVLNGEFACKFGKNDKGSLSVVFNDILNQTRSIRVFMENDFIRVERATILGRNAYLKITYAF